MQNNRMINPQNNLPEPLGVIVLIANFCFGLWNVYSNIRQEKDNNLLQKRQSELMTLLKDVHNDLGGIQCEKLS